MMKNGRATARTRKMIRTTVPKEKIGKMKVLR